jgi:hypothetical protein
VRSTTPSLASTHCVMVHNFTASDPVTADTMQQCFAAEDAVLPDVGHDFVFAACSPKKHE